MPRLLAALAAYLLAALAANILTDRFGLVPVGFGLLVTAGTFAAGAALLVRDFLHRYAVKEFGPDGIAVVLVAIPTAGALSWTLASPALAIASTIAFLAAEVVDLLIFAPLRSRTGFARSALVSNIVSTPVDTLAFLAIAGFPITLATVGGQLLGKLFWATVIPLALYVAARRAFESRGAK